MKFTYLFLACLILACNSNKSPEKKTTENSEQNTKKTISNMQDNPNEIAVKKGELEKLTPLSSEDMKKLIPETLLGFKRTSYSANNYTGLNMVSGDYEGENHQRIYLHIDDCSGLLGAELYEAHFSALANKDQESEGSYSKIIDYRNGKAMEYLDKRYNDCRLTWIAGGRFLVILDGKVIGAEKTKQAGLELKF